MQWDSSQNAGFSKAAKTMAPSSAQLHRIQRRSREAQSGIHFQLLSARESRCEKMCRRCGMESMLRLTAMIKMYLRICEGSRLRGFRVGCAQHEFPTKDSEISTLWFRNHRHRSSSATCRSRASGLRSKAGPGCARLPLQFLLEPLNKLAALFPVNYFLGVARNCIVRTTPSPSLT